MPEYAVYDPDVGWEEFDSAETARDAFDRAVEQHTDDAAEGWAEAVETLAMYRLTPVATVRLKVTGRAEDDSEKGRACRAAGWDYYAELQVQP